MRFTPYLLLCICFLIVIGRHAFAADNNRMEKEILQLTNQYRKSKGLPSLQPDDASNIQAGIHSRNMARKRVRFGHDGFQKRVQQISESLGRLEASAENVAYGQESAAEVVRTWINSAPHRKNLLGNYTKIGIGVAQNKEGQYYFTQIFIR